MNELENNTILINAKECFDTARLKLMQGAEYLYLISKGNLYEGAYSSFGEFVEQGCQISQGMSSKLIKVYEYYVVNGGLSHAKLTEIDSEKLYLALNLPGTPEEKMVRAETWTRSEIRQELASKDGVDCTHDCPHVTICSSCNARV